MRPVNLIPPEDRRGESAPTRTGGLAYVVVAVLAVALAAVCGVVMFNKRVADRTAEATTLEAEALELQAQADSLSPFVSFQQVRDARVQTIDSLAKSRFDWERVLREMSKVLPNGIWLTQLSGSVSPEVQIESAGDAGMRASVAGPAMTLTGCGRSHRDVARLIAAMKDIDGVTRVAVTSSAKPESAVAAAPTGDGASSAGCQTRSTIPQFDMIVAFDSAVAPAATVTPTTPEPTTPVASSSDGGVAEAQEQSSDSKDDVAAAQDDAANATNIVPGG